MLQQDVLVLSHHRKRTAHSAFRSPSGANCFYSLLLFSLLTPGQGLLSQQQQQQQQQQRRRLSSAHAAAPSTTPAASSPFLTSASAPAPSRHAYHAWHWQRVGDDNHNADGMIRPPDMQGPFPQVSFSSPSLDLSPRPGLIGLSLRRGRDLAARRRMKKEAEADAGGASGGGMSLSITDNMNVLRSKLLRELVQRRESMHRQSWVNRNQAILNDIGRRRRRRRK